MSSVSMSSASTSSHFSSFTTNQGVLIQPPCDDGFTASQKQLWSDSLSDTFDQAIDRTLNPNDARTAPKNVVSHFFNPAKTALTDKAKTATVSWVAFPRIVKVQHPNDKDRWTLADANPSVDPYDGSGHKVGNGTGRYVQDEYCEWSVVRDSKSGKITKVSFTCEGPEYWQFLAQTDPGKIVQLYKQHVGTQVQPADLFESDGTTYNPTNKWNNSTVNGVMHLIQPNNTLSAEIYLGGDATVLRTHNGKPVTDQQQLITCSQYGQPQRNSDPFIGFNVNQLVFKTGSFITFDNPVGLFFNSLDTAGWVTPDDADPASFWTYTRGTSDRPVRAVYEVTGKDYVVGDITINDSPIQFGGQIADFIKIKLTAVADALNLGKATSFPCVGDSHAPSASLAFAQPERSESETDEKVSAERSVKKEERKEENEKPRSRYLGKRFAIHRNVE